MSSADRLESNLAWTAQLTFDLVVLLGAWISSIIGQALIIRTESFSLPGVSGSTTC